MPLVSLIPVCTSTLFCSIVSSNMVFSWYVLPSICFGSFRSNSSRPWAEYILSSVLGSLDLLTFATYTMRLWREGKRDIIISFLCYMSVDPPHHLFSLYLQAFFSVGQSLLVFFEVSLISSDFLSKSLFFFLCHNFLLQSCYLMLQVNSRLLVRKCLTSSS